MKKRRMYFVFISILTILCIICGMTVYAVSTNAPSGLSVNYYKSGDHEITLAVLISDNKGFDTLSFEIQYPNRYFTLLSVERGEVIPEIDSTINRVVTGLSEKTNINVCSFLCLRSRSSKDTSKLNDGNGTVAIYKFSINDDMPDGQYEFRFAEEPLISHYEGANAVNSEVEYHGYRFFYDESSDLDGSKVIDEKDVELIRSYINTLAQGLTLKYDINNDGYINESDVENLREIRGQL